MRLHDNRCLQLAAVSQLHLGNVALSGVQVHSGAGGVHGQLIQILYAAQRGRSQSDPVQFGLFHLIQPGAAQQCHGIAGAQCQPVKRSGFSISLHGQAVRLLQPELENLQGYRPRSRVFHGYGYLQQLRPWRLPRQFQRFAAVGLFLHPFDAKRAFAFKVQGILAAHHQGGLVAGCQGPLAGLDGVQVEARPLPVVKTPLAAQHAGQIALRQRGRRIHQHQAACGRIGLHGQVHR